MSKNETLNKNQHNCPEVVCEQRKRWNQNRGGWGGAGGQRAGRQGELRYHAPWRGVGSRSGIRRVGKHLALGGCHRGPGPHLGSRRPCQLLSSWVETQGQGLCLLPVTQGGCPTWPRTRKGGVRALPGDRLSGWGTGGGACPPLVSWATASTGVGHVRVRWGQGPLRPGAPSQAPPGEARGSSGTKSPESSNPAAGAGRGRARGAAKWDVSLVQEGEGCRG